MKIYCDTNIYLDYLLNRKNLFNKNISNPAYNIFARTLECEFEIIISDHVMGELYANIETEKPKMLFFFLRKKLIVAKATKENKAVAGRLNSDFNDALHAVIAKKHKAEYLITRNLRDYKEISFIKAKLPENI